MEKVNLEDLEPRDLDGIEPQLKAVGHELRTEEMRPSVWLFEAGESNNRHRQRQQEELYYVVEGEGVMEVDGEEFDIRAGDFVAVPPEPWRQITATEACTILAVGAPNVKDDAVPEGDGDAG